MSRQREKFEEFRERYDGGHVSDEELTEFLELEVATEDELRELRKRRITVGQTFTGRYECSDDNEEFVDGLFVTWNDRISSALNDPLFKVFPNV